MTSKILKNAPQPQPAQRPTLTDSDTDRILQARLMLINKREMNDNNQYNIDKNQ